jgi:hypothetical protein
MKDEGGGMKTLKDTFHLMKDEGHAWIEVPSVILAKAGIQ